MNGLTKGIHLVLSLVVFLTCASELVAKRGHYLLVFSKELNAATIHLKFFLRSFKEANVSVTTPRNRTLLNWTFTLSGSNKKAMKKIWVDPSLAASESRRYSGNCVMIESTNSIRVFVVSNVADENHGTTRVSSGMLIPISLLSTYYMVLTSCKLSTCFITVASDRDGTHVQVRLSALKSSNESPTEISEIVYNDTVYQHGDVIVEDLLAWDSFQILANNTDLSGTLISSNSPIAVFSGGVSVETLRNHTQDKVIEQMPPVQSLEKTFVVKVPPVPSYWRYAVHIAMPHPNTTVKVVDYDTHYDVIKLCDDRQVLRINAGGTMILSANNGILVVLESSHSLSKEADDSMGSGFTLVTSVSRWKTQTRFFLVHYDIETKHQLVILTQANCYSTFEVNKGASQRVLWYTTGEYKSGFIQLPDVRDIVFIEAECPFGGFLFSYTNFDLWACTMTSLAKALDLVEAGPDLHAFIGQSNQKCPSTQIISKRKVPRSSTILETQATKSQTSFASNGKSAMLSESVVKSSDPLTVSQEAFEIETIGSYMASSRLSEVFSVPNHLTQTSRDVNVNDTGYDQHSIRPSTISTVFDSTIPNSKETISTILNSFEEVFTMRSTATSNTPYRLTEAFSAGSPLTVPRSSTTPETPATKSQTSFASNGKSAMLSESIVKSSDTLKDTGYDQHSIRPTTLSTVFDSTIPDSKETISTILSSFEEVFTMRSPATSNTTHRLTEAFSAGSPLTVEAPGFIPTSSDLRIPTSSSIHTGKDMIRSKEQPSVAMSYSLEDFARASAILETPTTINKFSSIVLQTTTEGITTPALLFEIVSSSTDTFSSASELVASFTSKTHYSGVPTPESRGHGNLSHDVIKYSIQPSSTEQDMNTSTGDVAREKNPGDTRSSYSYELNLCPCKCARNLDWIANITTREQEDKKQAIKRTLQVDISSLSRTIRRKTSSPDKRPGPTYYGSIMTAIVFGIYLAFIVVPDLLSVIYHCYDLVKKRK